MVCVTVVNYCRLGLLPPRPYVCLEASTLPIGQDGDSVAGAGRRGAVIHAGQGFAAVVGNRNTACIFGDRGRTKGVATDRHAVALED